ncbi:MAG: signal recognition particle-docking protein FtsY [Planctomycetota bacterium]|jgi:fused signal recognition particle receptor
MGVYTTTMAAVRRALGRTREALGGGLRRLLAGRELNEALIDEIEMRLITADVGVKTTAAILDELRQAFRSGLVKRGDETLEFLKRELKARLASDDRSIATAETGPTVILVAGVNGSGKTTSVAKLAHAMGGDGRSVLLAAADTFRAGAVAQLDIWADRLGVEIVKGKPGGDPAAVAFDAAEAASARDVDVLLIDTAGRLHTHDHLMRELTKIRNVVANKVPGAPHEVLLVLDATSGQNAIAQAEIFKKAIDITGIVLAKLDGTAKGGIVLAIQDALDIPVKLVGTGETPDAIEPFDPDAFVEAMFEE